MPTFRVHVVERLFRELYTDIVADDALDAENIACSQDWSIYEKDDEQTTEAYVDWVEELK